MKEKATYLPLEVATTNDPGWRPEEGTPPYQEA